MSQGTNINSTGANLSGGEGSGTHSGTMSALHALQRLKLEWIRPKEEPEEEEENQNRQRDCDASTSSRQSREQGAHTHTEREPVVVVAEVVSPPTLSGHQLRSLPPSQRAQLIDQPITVEVKIGDFHVADSEERLAAHISNLSPAQKEALDVAISGGLPDVEVYMAARHGEEETIQFQAGPQANSGWTVESANAPQQKFTAKELHTQFETRSAAALSDIAAVMNQTFEGEGPHTVSGTRYTISMDHGHVLVTENESGRIVDAVALNEISGSVLKASQEINGRDRTEQVKEALADYRFGGATTAPTPPPNRQPELTL